MKLSPEQVKEIIEALDSVAGAAGREKRKAARTRFDAAVDLVQWTEHGPSQTWTVQLRDYSANGIGFIHIEPMEAGAKFLLRLPLGKTNLGYVPCTTVSCVARDDGSYRIGARFADVLTRHDGQEPESQALQDLRSALLAA
jgi:hypothetical protein